MSSWLKYKLFTFHTHTQSDGTHMLQTDRMWMLKMIWKLCSLNYFTIKEKKKRLFINCHGDGNTIE